jgi:ATP-binding cassette subfamily C protein
MFAGMPTTFNGSYNITQIALATAFKPIGTAENNYASETFNQFLDNRQFFMNRLKFSYPTAKELLNLSSTLLKKKEIEDNKEFKIEFSNEINIKNLSFKYPNSDKLILSNLNLKILKNSFVGISGESGVGKSTLIDMILGLLKPVFGSILVDNIDISKNLRNWRNNIGYVPQKIFLISDSIKKNIALGLEDFEIDDQLLNQAIDRSCLRNFIQELEHKENTIVGEDGSLISWGQRQRIGIARALYNNPSILIFDEATSSLDPITEEKILDEIQLLKKTLTLIFVSHRKDSLKKCDKTFFMQNGMIFEILENNDFN